MFVNKVSRKKQIQILTVLVANKWEKEKIINHKQKKLTEYAHK